MMLAFGAASALAQSTLEQAPAGQAASEPPMRLRLDTMEVRAEPIPAPRTIGGAAPPLGPCVEVDIAGNRAGHLDCATQALDAAAKTAQAQARAGIDTPVVSAGSPDVQTGIASRTATRQRMGNQFGVSVHPQRPNRPIPPPRGGVRP